MNKVILDVENYNKILSNLQHSASVVKMIYSFNDNITKYGEANYYRLHFIEQNDKFIFLKYEKRVDNRGRFFHTQWFTTNDLILMLDNEYDFYHIKDDNAFPTELILNENTYSIIFNNIEQYVEEAIKNSFTGEYTFNSFSRSLLSHSKYKFEFTKNYYGRYYIKSLKISIENKEPKTSIEHFYTQNEISKWLLDFKNKVI